KNIQTRLRGRHFASAPHSTAAVGPAAVIAIFSTRKGRLLSRKSYTGGGRGNDTVPPLRPDSRSEASQRSGAPRQPFIGLPGSRTNQGQTPMATLAETSTRAGGMTKDEKFVIFASSLGTVFEWYDFYLYATLAPFFAALFFPPGNDTAALLSAFATYAAGFLVRPFGALIFGRIGDLVG